MSGLQKLFYPAIPDGRTWSNFGEHGEQRERREHGKDGKHQQDGLKDSIFDSKYSNCDSKHFFGNQMTQNTLHYGC